MFGSLFLKVIASIFLIIFIIKLINPGFIWYTIKLLIDSSVYTVTLLFTRTVYVIGLDIIFAIVFDLVITTIVYPHILNFDTWFTIFRNTLFDYYVLSFFIFTYLIGFYNFIKDKQNIKTNIFTYFENQFRKRFNFNGKYTFDEKENKYKYYD